MKLMAIILRMLAGILHLLPCKSRVALLSRQSSKMSMDYRMLATELEERLGPDKVVVCLTEPESKDILGFVAGTMKQLIVACTSKVIVVDGYVPAVSIPTKPEGVTVIQMWHSPGAIKKFGYQCLDTPAGRSRESAEAGRMHRNYDYVIAGGPGAKSAFGLAFDYPASKVWALGLPRIDFLLEQGKNCYRNRRARRILNENEFLRNGKPTILYAPTLRKGAGYDENWLTHNLGQLASALEARGGAGEAPANLIITGHPLNNEFSQALLREHPCVHVVPKTATIHLLAVCDAMISDYSAVAFEAALLGIPVELYVPDLDQYEKSPGLNIDLRKMGSTHTNAGEALSVTLDLALAHHAGENCENDFSVLTREYFEGIEYGCTNRIAELAVSKL